MIRVGIGYDAHPFAKDRRLIIGGIEIPEYIARFAQDKNGEKNSKEPTAADGKK